MYVTCYLIILKYGEFKSQGVVMSVIFGQIHYVLNLLAFG